MFYFICVFSVCVCIHKASHKLREKILCVRCKGGVCEYMIYDQMVTMPWLMLFSLYKKNCLADHFFFWHTVFKFLKQWLKKKKVKKKK